MAKKIGVILSGCGVYDGAEIHESVVTLLAIDRAGAEAVICAPNTEQLHVVNHLTGEVEEGASRNVLVWQLGEDARLILRPSGTEPKAKVYVEVWRDGDTLIFGLPAVEEPRVKRARAKLDRAVLSVSIY